MKQRDASRKQFTMRVSPSFWKELDAIEIAIQKVRRERNMWSHSVNSSSKIVRLAIKSLMRMSENELYDFIKNF